MVSNSSALKLYDDIYKRPQLAQKIQEELQLKDLPDSLTKALQSLLSVQEEVSPSYFMKMGTRLLNKAVDHRKSTEKENKMRAKELEDAKKLREQIRELCKDLPACGSKTQAKILFTMFERFIAGNRIVKDPRKVEDIVITPSEFLKEATPLLLRIRSEVFKDLNVPSKHKHAA